MKIEKLIYQLQGKSLTSECESITFEVLLEDEPVSEACQKLRQLAAESLASENRIDELYSRILRHHRACKALEERVRKAEENWQTTCEFLRSQGIKPDVSAFPVLADLPDFDEGVFLNTN